MARSETTVVVLYGGKSTEHEISCRSARFVIQNLSSDKYLVRAIGVDKDGVWWEQDVSKIMKSAAGPIPIERQKTPLQVGEFGTLRGDLVVFPVLHGTFGEDGCLQGLLELKEIAFVGPDTLGSAIGMDKIVAKKLASIANVPVVPWVDFRADDWLTNAESICAGALAKLGLPLFVKPARLGSSVGVSKVTDSIGLKHACEQALVFDDRVLIEKGLSVREIEVAALGGFEPMVSVPGEVIPHGDFYSYDAKYISADGASIAVPAKLTAEEINTAQELARRVFKGLELYGMARIDLFLDKHSGHFYFNEVNTIPGFTEISQYPMLWRESGISAVELVDRLITTALNRQKMRLNLRRTR